MEDEEEETEEEDSEEETEDEEEEDSPVIVSAKESIGVAARVPATTNDKNFFVMEKGEGTVSFYRRFVLRQLER
jgi:phage repressor protein C with HTH and peptisase S24 domain